MGDVVQMQRTSPRHAGARTAIRRGPAEIMLFTGVRYELAADAPGLRPVPPDTSPPERPSA